MKTIFEAEVGRSSWSLPVAGLVAAVAAIVVFLLVALGRERSPRVVWAPKAPLLGAMHAASAGQRPGPIAGTSDLASAGPATCARQAGPQPLACEETIEVVAPRQPRTAR